MMNLYFFTLLSFCFVRAFEVGCDVGCCVAGSWLGRVMESFGEFFV